MHSLGDLQSALGGRYRIERELGRGGMAAVYLAHDLRHDRPVAVKVLDAELTGEIGAARFLREIRLAARLAHPNLLPLFDSGEITGAAAGGAGPATLYYVMPYVAGESLRARLTREGPLPLEDVVRIARALASALDYAHAQGVLHRDVKPENILLEAGEPVLADLGIARAVDAASGDRITTTGIRIGTPAYMSPEQAVGDRHVDGRTDQYALACVVYEMLTGEAPFRGGSGQAVIARRLIEPPPRPGALRDGCPPAVDAVVARAMARTPADRYASAGEFARELARAAGRPGDTAGAPAEPPAQSSRRPPPRRALRAGALGGAALGAVAAAVLALREPAQAVAGPASVLAVVPLAPTGADTALERLGRDLVVTVSQTLDGIGGIRTVDARTILAYPAGRAADPSHALAIAREYGAGAVLHGNLVRLGGRIRADLVLTPADSGPALARVSASAHPDSLGALTDSIVRGVLRETWEGPDAPTPSLDAALRTRSLDALRAFITGEEMTVRGQWIEAADAYARAVAADSTFLLAYWREAYARSWHGERMDPAVRALLTARMHELPRRERLMVEATRLLDDSVSGSLATLRELTTVYPDHWFGWLMYGDILTHFGAAVGIPRRDALAALRRAVSLNPNLLPAWEHIAWLALLERDTAAAGAAIREVARAGPAATESFGWDQAVTLALCDRLIRGDGAGAAALADEYVADMVARPDPSFGASAVVRHGFPAEQIAATRRIIAGGVPAAALPSHRSGLIRSFAFRGAWDSALAYADEGAATALFTGPVAGWRLAVIGVWAGALDPAVARARRDAAFAAAGAREPERAELLWLDGVAAFAAGDVPAVEAAAAALAPVPGPAAAVQRRSLAAYARGMRGSPEAAARELEAIEAERAERGYADAGAYPALTVVNRLTAARWLAAEGEHDDAMRLLRWFDGIYAVNPAIAFGVLLGPIAGWERGRIAEAAGDDALAAEYYREFLRVYDMPPAGHAALVEEARRALAR